MWDGGVNHLDLQPLAPMTDSNEMGENLDSILLKLKQILLTEECSKQLLETITLQRNE
jgi:cytochrome c peroxidase